ncbi:antibiotic ABC transporter ATP-binding protein [Heyndrickxia shackletonii]|uniref:Antibiotic ABC transporter ATP-binding protein n=1 Tax=Heyndrickxia shackletonii TaxID=157838 RepID=A0A0Q3TJ79_9BACI|nr:ABC transporter ATP-binding protein [Heyndrickxia shackletonii]KQL54008.1 antibiotic ABC transporter ATP-binding protein [Heyndrickxia shackletonii]NEY97701.1 ABC transporter ATP-binding protein [Heyndrickxia shackletonii]
MLTISNIKKSFKDHHVVKDVSFEVQKGEAFGLLGPNGAGKSTTISMICGLIPYDEGEIQVDGLSVKKKPMKIREKIGVVPQDIALYPTMSAYDNLVFWGKMYGLTGKTVKQRAYEVLEIVGLKDRAKDKIETFSGGMKRRINIGAALMHEPELLIMDEPTVGIDPQSRNHILETVKRLNEAGMTIIYTSHYMEEVEYLCKRIAIIDYGKLIAIGDKTELCNRLAGGHILELTVDNPCVDFLIQLESIDGIENANMREDGIIEIILSDKNTVLSEVISLSLKQNISIQSMQIKEPNLESLFLQLTGRTLRD